MLKSMIYRIIYMVLSDCQHDGWKMVYEFFFTCLCDDGSNTTFEKSVANAVTEMVCEYLPERMILDEVSINLLYGLYAEFADEFEKRVREHIMHKVYHSKLCEVV